MACESEVGYEAHAEARQQRALTHTYGVGGFGCGKIHEVDTDREPEMEELVVVIRIDLCFSGQA